MKAIVNEYIFIMAGILLDIDIIDNLGQAGLRGRFKNK